MAQRKPTLHSFIPFTKVFKTSASLSGFMLLAPLAAQAQITPDQTLGAEASQVDRNVNVRGALGDRINGGAIRGVNNFHSFSDFNVLNDQRVYFSNQSGVENIITRVTGGNGSNIYGTLGVDGKANLFLINPNGIVFGPNAQLDVAGSFWAGTSDRVLFSNGESFGTNSSSVPALVEVNIPIGLQMGKNAIGMVRNEAKLVAGKDLGLVGTEVVSSGSLTADRVQVSAENAEVQQVTARSAMVEAKQNIVLNSSQLKTTEDLTLKAEGTVQARDTVAQPLSVVAGRDLQVQGNQKIDILALNHPTPAFQAGGDLKLISNGVISGDSHFTSGGNFSILNLNGQPGSFLSLYDPIIRSDKNVKFAGYTGNSLKVEAKGSIEVTGDIIIAAPDATTIPATDPDVTTLTSQPALILRSGVTTIAASSGIVAPFTEPGAATNPGDITVKNIVVGTATEKGRVILEAQNNGVINLGDVVDTKQGQTDLKAKDINIKAGGVMFNGIVNFDGGAVKGGPINGGTGDDTFNFNAGSIANNLQIDAKGGTDIFNLKGTTFGTGVNLKGGTGNDTVTADGANNTFAISGANNGSVRGANVSGIEIYIGSGTDTVTGSLGPEMFKVTAANQVTVSNIDFTGVEAIDGKDGSDTYQLSDGVPPSAIAINDTGIGAGNIDRLDYSLYTTDPNVTLAAIGAVGIEEVRGRAPGNSTITALNQPNAWTLNNGGSGTINSGVPGSINTLRFSNFNRLIGGGLEDAFTISSGASGFNLIDGGLGVNTIVNTTANQTVAITGPSQGSFNSIAFQNIVTFQGSGTDTLLGTTGDDIFFASAANAFSLNGVNITGVNGVDGSTGVDTVINTSGAQTIAIAGNNQISTLGKTFKAIENFTGSGSDTILGTSGNDSFSIKAANTVQASEISFTGVQNIDGADGNDIFTLDGGSLTGKITGGGGINTLLGQDLPAVLPLSPLNNSDEFILTDTQQGIVRNSGIQFVPSPFPPFLPDQFIPFTTDTRFEKIQKIDGRGGTDTLTGTPAAEIFNLGSLSSASGVAVTNVEALNGGGGNDTLQGDTSSNLFNITGLNSGTVGSLAFSNMPNLEGLAGDDQFVLSAGGNITGNLLGGDGNDIFELNGGTIAGQIDGGNDLDLVLGSNSDDIFQLTGPKAGTVNGASFTNIETADARAGNDTLKGTNGPDNFLITDAFVATSAGFQAKNFETIDGLDGDNLFTIQSGNLTTLLGGTGKDIVNLEGGTVGTTNLGDGNDLFALKTGDGKASTVNLGNGDDTVQVEGNSSITGALDGGAGSLTILGKDNLQGLPTAANSISGTGILQLGAIDPKTGIIINDGTTNPNAVAITPTNLQAIKPGFTQVILKGSTIGVQANVNTMGNSFKLDAPSIDAQSGQFNTNDGNLDLFATNQVNLNNSIFSTTSGNLTILAPTLALNNSTLSTTTGTLTLNTPTQTLTNAAKITSISGPIAITSTAQTLNSGSTIVTTSGPITINTVTQTLNNSSAIASNSSPIAITTQTQILNGASSITNNSGPIGINTQTQILNGASTITTNSGNIGITAQDIALKEASKITSTTGNIDITARTVTLQGNTPAAGTPTAQLSQPRADRAEIATRSFTPGIASGNLTLNTTNLTLDNAALIAETGRGAPNGNVRINFPDNAQSPTLTGKLELKNSSLILAQGDRRSNGDVLFTGGATVKIDPVRASVGQDGSDIITNANLDRSGGAILFEAVDNPGKTFTPLAQSFSNAGFVPRKVQTGNGTNDLSTNEVIDLPPPSTQQSDNVSVEFTDPNKLVSAECQPKVRQSDRRSQFSIAGKGGLPSNPTTVLGSESSQDDWVTLPVPKAPTKPMVKDQPEVIAQAPTKLKPPSNKPAQCLQSWEDSQNIKSQNK
jgi:filamentous hemagglutinin family protein